MPANDDLEVIRELLAARPPSQDVNDRIRVRVNAVIAAAESHLPPGLIDHVLVEAGARAPAGMTRRVARWCRRRPALSLAAGVAAALTAGAVALAVIGVPGAGHGGAGTSVVDAAYVVKRVDGALRAAGSGEIAQVTFTLFHGGGGTASGTTTGEGWSYGGRWRQVSYSSAGYPVEDVGASAASVYTQVSYRARTWSRGPRPDGLAVLPLSPAVLPGVRDCGSRSQGPVSVVGALRAAVSCGTLTEAGRQRVGGVDAIKLTGRGSGMSETIWVSPGTYLPLRVVTRMPSGSSQVADYAWLKPTGRNLARLAVPVPAGFRRVPPSAMAPPYRHPGPGATGASPPAARRR